MSNIQKIQALETTTMRVYGLSHTEDTGVSKLQQWESTVYHIRNIQALATTTMRVYGLSHPEYTGISNYNNESLQSITSRIYRH